MKKHTIAALAIGAAVAFTLIAAPSHATEIPDPVETAPAVTVVDVAPGAPVFVDECGTAADSWAPPADPGPWLYEATTPVLDGDGAVIDQGYVSAFLPDGFVLPNGDTSWTADYWELSRYHTDVPCPVEPPATPVEAEAPPTPPQPAQPAQPAPVAPAVPDELAATGPSPWMLPVAGVALLAIAAGAALRRPHARS